MKPTLPSDLARALRGFFADYLPRVRGASPHTIRSYRDAITLLLRFLSARRERDVVGLELRDLTPDEILAFLDHLEVERTNNVLTRNARLAAIHAFARYAAASHPEHMELFQRLLAVPFKRARQRIVDYLETDEIRAILEAPDRNTADGRRDRVLLLTLFNTGARAQEILDLRPCDLQLVRPFHVRLRGKGGKERICPVWPQTVECLQMLLAERATDATDVHPLFRNHRGQPLTRFGLRFLLRKHAHRARETTPTLDIKRVHPHVLRPLLSKNAGDSGLSWG